MELIGMLHHRKLPHNVTKSYAYAAVAKAEGAEMLFFSPRAVNLKEKSISGYIYNNGLWMKTQSPFPDVIYNTGSPIKLARSKEILSELREQIPFTTNSIGNKMRVYKRLEKAGVFQKYLIPSHYVKSFKEFFERLNYYKKIVFKPLLGHKGEGIVFVERSQDDFHLLINSNSVVYTWEELKSFISKKLRHEVYIVQPYIYCKTKNGQAYDFRLHVQKNQENKWMITAIYPRMGGDGSIVSNINSGGSTNYLVPFLKQEFGDEYYNIKRYLEVFSLQLATHMEEIQKNSFSEEIDELGIDVGLDDQGKLWIFEVNWRPGCPPAFYLELDSVKYMIKYALYLSKEHKRKSQIHDHSKENTE